MDDGLRQSMQKVFATPAGREVFEYLAGLAKLNVFGRIENLAQAHTHNVIARMFQEAGIELELVKAERTEAKAKHRSLTERIGHAEEQR